MRVTCKIHRSCLLRSSENKDRIDTTNKTVATQQKPLSKGTSRVRIKVRCIRRLRYSSPHLQQPAKTMSNTSKTSKIRCPCGFDKQLTISTRAKGKKAWIMCKDCSAWQHPICVGLLEDRHSMSKDYFCEECKPQHHGRFEFGPGLDDPDNRVVIAKEAKDARGESIG
jgi:hypothetical protein